MENAPVVIYFLSEKPFLLRGVQHSGARFQCRQCQDTLCPWLYPWRGMRKMLSSKSGACPAMGPLPSPGEGSNPACTLKEFHRQWNDASDILIFGSCIGEGSLKPGPVSMLWSVYSFNHAWPEEYRKCLLKLVRYQHSFQQVLQSQAFGCGVLLKIPGFWSHLVWTPLC